MCSFRCSLGVPFILALWLAPHAPWFDTKFGSQTPNQSRWRWRRKPLLSRAYQKGYRACHSQHPGLEAGREAESGPAPRLLRGMRFTACMDYVVVFVLGLSRQSCQT